MLGGSTNRRGDTEKAGRVSDCSDRTTPNRIFRAVPANARAAGSEELLSSIAPLALQDADIVRKRTKEPTELRFRQLGDERAFLAASVMIAEPRSLTEPEWMRLAFVDEVGPTPRNF